MPVVRPLRCIWNPPALPRSTVDFVSTALVSALSSLTDRGLTAALCFLNSRFSKYFVLRSLLSSASEIFACFTLPTFTGCCTNTHFSSSCFTFPTPGHYWDWLASWLFDSMMISTLGGL